MESPLLKITGLKTWLEGSNGTLRAVDGIDLEIARGETFALLGESGCGKSMSALSIMRLVPSPAGRIVAGSILLEDEDLVQKSEVQMRSVRGARIAMIFQEPMTSLNPVLTVGAQIGESLRKHKGLKNAAQHGRVLELLNAVGIPDPEKRINEFPHQLSGGMKQRVMIAIALAGEPDLLIADEPTTALDVTIQAQVLQLLKDLQKKTGMAILLITHDLGVVAQMANHVGVMYAGEIVEVADRDSFFSDPKHPYSCKLFDSVPTMEKRLRSLEVIKGSVPALTQEFSGCRFEPRCDQAWGLCRETPPGWHELDGGGDHFRGVRCHLKFGHMQGAGGRGDSGSDGDEANGEIPVLLDTGAEAPVPQPLLEVNDLMVHFPVHKGLFRRTAGHVFAVDGVSLQLHKGRTVALVGESGCGKTTAGKGILQLLRQVAKGSVLFEGKELGLLSAGELRKQRAHMQIIFQDPYSSMNPRMMVGDIIEEGMIAQSTHASREARRARVDELLLQVGLAPEMKTRYPHEFSGGQRQRICIARALAVDPRLIICDEPTSALDVSVQAQILNLLKRLQAELGLSYLFITHNISVVAYLAHEVAVMYLGRIVEQGPVREVLAHPMHPYTRALLSAVPVVDPKGPSKIIQLEGDLPSPMHPPQGCHFHPRCPQVMPQCSERYPEISGRRHTTRCFLYSDVHPDISNS